MASLSGEKTLAELSAEFGVHPTMISSWKQELVKRAGELFARGSKALAVEDAQKVIDELHRKIGRRDPIDRSAFRATGTMVCRLPAGGDSHERTRLCRLFPDARENTGILRRLSRRELGQTRDWAIVSSDLYRLP